uniref:Transcriptional repressor TUP1 n=1 Tax=Ganoderma boninense TaxID=34458 RepID=A0A5K1JX24_9APHY|nr:Transcriptional repressor TUP1 [Ganoderma boninense]
MDEDDPRPWKVTTEAPCKDNPECIKYKPGSSLLAVQCNDGSVYLMTEGNTIPRCFSIAPTERRHVTADMAWGTGLSDKLLFASSACLEGESGFHKAYDVTKHKVVIEFDADRHACSTLTLDPSGDRLYIATEGPGRIPAYTLRQYDVRNGGNRKAQQQVKLKPFAGSLDRMCTEINSLSLSPDGIYIAVGRSDNWVDVYDSRMLQRRELHSFAHEGGGPDTYGVVKTQWVDSYPFGFGLVSGGVDGCIRLWDTKLASSDPVNGKILARGDYDVATFSLGDIYKKEVPIIVGERSGKVTLYDFASTSHTRRY